MVLVVVLGLHVLALLALPKNPGGGRGAAARPLMQVRQIHLKPVPDVEVDNPGRAPHREAVPARVAAAGEPVPATRAAPAEPEAAPPAAPEAEGEAIPTYATRLPPPMTLHYALRRGPASGSATLEWQLDAQGRYRLDMQGSLFDQRRFNWQSQGQVDAQGLAPDRFLVSRGRRAARAVNFQREVGKISFSGPTIEVPWLPGAQDRLSWWIQLAGILEATPALRENSAEVVLFVAGARGDAAPWRFTVAGREAVALAGGKATEALLVRRLPRGAYDTMVEAWLDPARGHLPLRVRLSTPDTGDVSEFTLTPSTTGSIEQR